MSRSTAVLVSVLLTVATTVLGVAYGERPAEQRTRSVSQAGSLAASGLRAAALPPVALLERPAVTGDARYGRTLTADPGRWAPRDARLSLQWLRDGRPVPGATGRRLTLRPEDVGRRVALRVSAAHPERSPAVATSRPVRVRHAVPVRRTVTYRVETRGPVTADLATFRRLAQETFDDPRGWRAGGTAFRRVARGGDFSLVLATPEQLPRFSSACSAEWSCRVGRHVVVNQRRWLTASPAWSAAGGSLRDYRHMVVNHETGHWLGRGHRGCPGPSRAAPVMQQQSKGLGGCRPNPWPLPGEL